MAQYWERTKTPTVIRSETRRIALTQLTKWDKEKAQNTYTFADVTFTIIVDETELLILLKRAARNKSHVAKDGAIQVKINKVSNQQEGK